MEYSITRALSELKVLEKRFYSGIDDLHLVAVKHGLILRRPYSSIKSDDFKKKAEAGDQSVRAIEERIALIKKKIAEVNSKTIVTIGSREMTIQEALIEKSTIIPLKEARLAKYKKLLTDARNQFDAAGMENEEKIQRNIQDRKDVITEMQAREEIESTRKVEMVDPLNLADKIKELEDEITDFKGNVDFALSEKNSTTYIQIED
jgi:hypothetical protein